VASEPHVGIMASQVGSPAVYVHPAQSGVSWLQVGEGYMVSTTQPGQPAQVWWHVGEPSQV
jgi:hypothetical protein